MTTPPILPVVQGDWVARDAGGDFEIARVRQAYLDDGIVYCDLVPYSLAGENIGRQSPPEGGPKAFEPWCQFTDNGWQRIERPAFPLKREMAYTPSGDGKVTLSLTVFHDKRGSVKPKPVRTKPRKQSGDHPRGRVRIVHVPGDPSNAPQIEVASLRRAAQELRDQAREVGFHSAAAASGMRARAAAMEAEAAALEKKP